MAIENINADDTLESGFRVKTNSAIDALINSNPYVHSDGTIRFPKHGGGEWTLDLSSKYFTKSQVGTELSPTLGLATESIYGRVKRATINSALAGENATEYITPALLKEAILNIPQIVDTYAIGDNLFEFGSVNLLATGNTEPGLKYTDEVGNVTGYVKQVAGGTAIRAIDSTKHVVIDTSALTQDVKLTIPNLAVNSVIATANGLTTNYLPKLGANGVLVNSIISEDDFRVGVGFANPLFTFDVRQVSPYTYNRASFGGMSPDGSSHGYMLIPPNGGGFFDVIRRNNTALRFATETSLGFGFSTQMTLTADGKLGVKTPDPTHDFHVNGTTRTNKLLVNKSTDSGEVAQFNGTVQVNALKVTGLTTNYLPKLGADGVLGNSQVFDNGVSVAIGTSTPAAGARLHIAGTLAMTSGQQISLASNNLDFSTIRRSGGILLTNNNSTVLLSDGGNFGVKTLAPTDPLHVNGTTRTTNLKINAGAAVGTVWQCTNADGSGAWISPLANYQIDETNADGGVRNSFGLIFRDEEGSEVSRLVHDQTASWFGFETTARNSSDNVFKAQNIIDADGFWRRRLDGGEGNRYALLSDIVSSGGTVTPTLQAVTTQGLSTDKRIVFQESAGANYAFATVSDTVRLKYRANGGTAVNYALTSELAGTPTLQNVLDEFNTTTVDIIHKYTSLNGFSGTQFLNQNGSTVGGEVRLISDGNLEISTDILKLDAPVIRFGSPTDLFLYGNYSFNFNPTTAVSNGARYAFEWDSSIGSGAFKLVRIN
jgi:hypothetical protein